MRGRDRLGEMSTRGLSSEEVAALSALALGIIPADEVDAGAEEVNAGVRLAERVERGVNPGVYVRGLETARRVSLEKFGVEVSRLDRGQVHELIGALREVLPAFFKQL